MLGQVLTGPVVLRCRLVRLPRPGRAWSRFHRWAAVQSGEVALVSFCGAMCAEVALAGQCRAWYQSVMRGQVALLVFGICRVEFDVVSWRLCMVGSGRRGRVMHVAAWHAPDWSDGMRHGTVATVWSREIRLPRSGQIR